MVQIHMQHPVLNILCHKRLALGLGCIGKTDPGSVLPTNIAFAVYNCIARDSLSIQPVLVYFVPDFQLSTLGKQN